MKNSRWLQYFTSLKCEQASNKTFNIEYGEEIYRSPQINNILWIVTKFEHEYNIFTENKKNQQRIWATCFKGRNRAIAFALKMILICSGKLKRKDLL